MSPTPTERAWIEPAVLSLLGHRLRRRAPQQLFGAWRTFFERLAATGPVVMVFEDFHHADSGLMDFIDQLLEWSRSVPILILTLARPELLERRPDWGAGKRSFTSIHLEPLPIEAMRELLGGLVPGLPTAARDAIVARADGVPLYAVETVRMLLAQGRLVLEGGVYRPVDELSDLAVPETLTALISARLDELDARRSEPRRGRSRPRPELHPGRPVAPSPASTSRRSNRACGPSSAASCWSSRSTRARPSAASMPSSRRSSARSPTTRWPSVTARSVISRQHATSSPSAPTSWPEHSPATTSPPRATRRMGPRPTPCGPGAGGAARRRRAGRRPGSHAQAVTFLEHALAVSPDPTDRADLHERALASAMQGLVAEVAERHALGALEARRELGDREAIALATAAYARCGLALRPATRTACSSSCCRPGRSSRISRRPGPASR